MNYLKLFIVCLFISSCLPTPGSDDDDTNSGGNNQNGNDTQDTVVAPSSLSLSTITSIPSATINGTNEDALIEFGKDGLGSNLLRKNTRSSSTTREDIECDLGSAYTETLSSDYDDSLITAYGATNNYYDNCIWDIGSISINRNGDQTWEMLVGTNLAGLFAGVAQISLKFAHDNYTLETTSTDVSLNNTVFRHGSVLTQTVISADINYSTANYIFSNDKEFGAGTFQMITPTTIVEDSETDQTTSGLWSILGASGTRIDYEVTGPNVVTITANGVSKGSYVIDN